MQVNYRQRLFYLLLFTSLLKLLVAGLIDLGNDEVYYYTYAEQLDWSHFDHPPMVGLLMRLTSLNLHLVNEVTMRLGAIIGSCISTYFIFKIGSVIKSERTGWFAALIFNCSVYTGIISGLFILPDSPQIPFWVASLYIMSRMIINEEDRKINLWLLLGLFIGLATLCKVHGLYLWAGFGLFIIIKRIKWLLNWRLYVAVFITAICMLPIIYWNMQNHFITYQFHSARVSNHHIQISSFIQELIGEFLYQNPIAFVLIIFSVIYCLKNKNILASVTNVWLLCMGLPMIFLFWGISLFNSTLPHWSGPGYIALFFFAAAYLDEEIQEEKLYPLITKFAGGLIIFVMIAGTAFIKLAPFNTGSQKVENYGEGCPTLDLSGWKTFSKEFELLVKDDIASGKMNANALIVIHNWFPGGHLEFYTSRASKLPVVGIGDLDHLHKFAWLNKVRRKLDIGNDAYCIVPSNLPFDPMLEYKDYFTTIEQAIIINQIRGKRVVRYFYVYRMKNCKIAPENILK